MGQLNLVAPTQQPPTLDPYGRPASVPPPSDRYPDNRYYDQPPQPPNAATQAPPYGAGRLPGPPPGARIPVTPGFPQEPSAGRASGGYDVPPPGQPPSSMDGGYGPPVCITDFVLIYVLNFVR